MDIKNSGIDSDSKNGLDQETPKLTSGDPIITFSPDRTRFDHKSRNPSITSDFDINLEVSYPATEEDVKVGQQLSTSLTELLTSSSQKQELNSPEIGIINNFIGLELKKDLTLNSCDQSQQGVTTASNVCGLSMSAEVANVGPTIEKMSASLNGSGNAGSTVSSSSSSTTILQKKLERKIAQASAIAAAMNSMSRQGDSPIISPNDETEFGGWHLSSDFSAGAEAKSNKTSAKSNPTFQSESNTEPSNTLSTAVVSKSTKPKSKSSSSSKSRPSSITAENRKPAYVKFQEDEVEIISKSSRANKVPGGLIPPERLAVPNKGRLNGRKHSNKVSVSDADLGQNVNPGESGETSNANHPRGSSEVKPLVEWDSDESEEELSFFPANKPKVKLTDNLSIDNMSLSGDEDDLHLSPPTPMRRKLCPCDPNQIANWVEDHVKLPKSHSFPGREGHCAIS